MQCGFHEIILIISLRFGPSHSPKKLLSKNMAITMSRVKQEQLRKRRNNLLRRHNDFWRLYSIRSWLIMEMPNGRLYTYRSNPEMVAPTEDEMVRPTMQFCNILDLDNVQKLRTQPTVHRTPLDYNPDAHQNLHIPKPPIFEILRREKGFWDYLNTV